MVDCKVKEAKFFPQTIGYVNGENMVQRCAPTPGTLVLENMFYIMSCASNR